jgi:hypothetical protein
VLGVQVVLIDLGGFVVLVKRNRIREIKQRPVFIVIERSLLLHLPGQMPEPKSGCHCHAPDPKPIIASRDCVVCAVNAPFLRKIVQYSWVGSIYSKYKVGGT